MTLHKLWSMRLSDAADDALHDASSSVRFRRHQKGSIPPMLPFWYVSTVPGITPNGHNPLVLPGTSIEHPTTLGSLARLGARRLPHLAGSAFISSGVPDVHQPACTHSQRASRCAAAARIARY
jgi:hypothetical protein